MLFQKALRQDVFRTSPPLQSTGLCIDPDPSRALVKSDDRFVHPLLQTHGCTLHPLTHSCYFQTFSESTVQLPKARFISKGCPWRSTAQAILPSLLASATIAL